ncbi:hypothetical protein AOL_s00097g236 [Orbilia oligospora ATCC 24927]|uniref:Fido domain-containing protein n=1 Tax=Arthrobotrys oligospora (strain ATCC 24927 / CBS 115.81 / DSM 1491) TaxID=756982 RepID=G1XIQ9_ARTOA|nr:hypothetical protein AOL_s00097g236 [Orbilia oligospora ATCC 24927]EGX46810.1 hypothetical protein AOL_s00097g236 [Orbilia oligospora ATCC 24927]
MDHETLNFPLKLAAKSHQLPEFKSLVSGRTTTRHPSLYKSDPNSTDTLNDTYERAITLMIAIRSHCKYTPEEPLSQAIQTELINLIYGSNFIEYAGTDYTTTTAICTKLFNEYVSPEEILNTLQTTTTTTTTDENTSGTTTTAVDKKGGMEVIQHAKALTYFLQKFYIEEEPLTEFLILQTHRILCEGTTHSDGTPWQEWAGIYRTHEIAASSIPPTININPSRLQKKSIFIRATAVPKYMTDMVEDFKSLTGEAEIGNFDVIDPFEIAAWLCTRFVNIHPFADGNGRVCRILLSGVLMRYTGLVACIGDEGETDSTAGGGRDEYLGIVNKANKIFHDEDGEVDVEAQTSHVRLTELVVRKVLECAERLVEVVIKAGDVEGE